MAVQPCVYCGMPAQAGGDAPRCSQCGTLFAQLYRESESGVARIHAMAAAVQARDLAACRRLLALLVDRVDDALARFPPGDGTQG